jgi:hypothetical protein
MRLEDYVLFAVILAAAVTAVPWLIFALASLLAGFPRLRLHQILGIVGVAAWVFAFLNRTGPFGGNELLVFVTIVACFLGFAGMWNHEFRLLMLRRPDEFPDPRDRLAWIFLLTVMAPAGVWLFRSYRKARWPEAVAAGPHPLDSADPLEGRVRMGA